MGVDMEYCKFCQECVHVDYIVKCENCVEYIEFDGDCICDRCIDDEDPAVIKDQHGSYFCRKECKECNEFHEKEAERKEKEKATNLYHCDSCNVDIKRSSKTAHFLSKKHKKLGNIL